MNIIYGLNGHGKTNIIEAIHFISSARSFRTSAQSDLVSWGTESCSAFGRVVDPLGDIEIGIVINNRRKEPYLNGDRVNALSEYVGRLICLTFTPFDLELIKGAPVERRQFMDKHIVDLKPRFIKSLISYNKALKSKNALLQDHRVNVKDLESWNAVLAGHGVEIVNERVNFIRELERAANTVHARFAPSDGPLKLRLKSKYIEGESEAIDQQGLFNLIQASVHSDIQTRSSRIGPHKDDLEISYNQHATRNFASQGQSRSIVLSLKLAALELIEKERGTAPIVLLDDVDSELDSERASAFFGSALSGSRQVFITGTNPEMSRHFRARPHSIFEVNRGQILRCDS